MKYGIVYTTVGKLKDAKRIAETLVKTKLAACVNITKPVESFYTWKGKLVRDKEILLIIKTKSSLFRILEKKIKSMHSYEVPEIILTPIQKGFKPYLGWLNKETKS